MDYGPKLVLPTEEAVLGGSRLLDTAELISSQEGASVDKLLLYD